MTPYSVDLEAIAALSGSGYARRITAGSWALDTTIPTSRGGTGLTAYSPGDLLYANISSTLSRLAEPGLPGYVLSAVGGFPSWTQLSTLTATQITGTANQVLVNGTSGSGQTGPVTLTTPQNIHTAATPQFAGLGIGVAAVAGTPLWSEVSLNNLAFHINRNTNTGAAARATNLVWADTAQILFQAFSSGNTSNLLGIAAANAANLAASSSSGLFITTDNTSPIIFGINNVEVGRFVVAGFLTAAPSGGSAQPWKLGNYTAGVAVQAGKVRVEINGTPYDLLTA